MKNLITLLLMIIGINISAQNAWGLKAGANLSTINDKFIDYDFKTGLYAGAFYNIKFAKQLAFQPEILLSFQGAKAKNEAFQEIVNGNTVNLGTYDIENELMYLQIPLMLKYYFIPKLNFEVGPQIGFALKNEITLQSPEIGTQNTDVDSNVELGINLGLECEFYEGIQVGFRYNKGLTKIRKDSEHKNDNTVFSLGLSYSFN